MLRGHLHDIYGNFLCMIFSHSACVTFWKALWHLYCLILPIDLWVMLLQSHKAKDQSITLYLPSCIPENCMHSAWPSYHKITSATSWISPTSLAEPSTLRTRIGEVSWHMLMAFKWT
jgi:hypothetical protein